MPRLTSLVRRRPLRNLGARLPCVVSCLAVLVGAPVAGQQPPAPVRDPHSFARPEEARVTHLALDLRADFRTRTLAGTATLHLVRADDARELVLDTADLSIEAVTDPAGRPLSFTLGPRTEILGRPLRIELVEGVSRVTIRYRTGTAAALQWLTPAQTAGKRHPYLYSQGQAILTRSWIPTQDSPGIRQTYEATITAPEPLRVLMSAEHLTPEGRALPEGRAFDFRMTQPIPAYLIALAIGDLAFAPVGPRTGVFAEPSVLKAAAYEFGELERMLEAAEALYGPYRWGRYDIVVLPPSFPYGGMENPRLTFVSPTILAGDRSLTSIAAHELAHSWSGNLVTNATWEHFWINEGFTTYIENRIMEALYGRERAMLLEHIERQGLLAELRTLPPADTALYISLEGRDPDETSSVPYAKGQAFLRMLEVSLGRDRLDTWLRGFFERHAFSSLTTEGFREDLRAHALEGDEAREEGLQLKAWLYGPGLPTNVSVPAPAVLKQVDAEVTRFTNGTPASSLAVSGWSPQEWQHFLGALPLALSDTQVADLDATFRLSRTGNSAVLFDWLRIVVRHHYRPALPALERFLTSMGRTRFVLPLFEDLVKTDWGRATARTIYARARPLYHSSSRTAVEAVLKMPGE